MAVWRTKACEMFGFAPNQYSYAHGKAELFADLLHFATKSESDSRMLDLIAAYVTWASKQTSDQLASSVDIAFFLPMFRDQRIYDLFRTRISPELLATKYKLLMSDGETQSL